MTSNNTISSYRLGYHLMAPVGWINDPNGFCYFKGHFHIFYQYHPYSAKWGPMHWGHARSCDLLHWETLPIALTPDKKYDRDGCYSGSAIVKNDQLYLIYTGHINETDQYHEVQNLAFSTDGIKFTKYENNPIIPSPPANNTTDFRDPNVWEHDGQYYAIVGGRTFDRLGQISLYSSSNLKKWNFIKILAKSCNSKSEGEMWECPNLFYLNGSEVLLCSPQGIQAQEKKYLNLHQTGYFIGQLDLEKMDFKRKKFQELDQGHDFYAAQTMLSPDGRRILIGWMDMWHSPMPEQAYGWAGALTLPRELILKGDHIFQLPIAETKYLRQKKLREVQLAVTKSEKICSGQNQIEIQLTIINPLDKNFALVFTDPTTQSNVVLRYKQENFTLIRSDRKDARFTKIHTTKKLYLQIFVDRSSIEFFFNNGESVMTERYYFNESPVVTIESNKDLKLNYQIYQLEQQTNNYKSSRR